MSRRDDQYGSPSIGAWLEVMGENVGGTCTVTVYQPNGAVLGGVSMCDVASVGLKAEELRALCHRLGREAELLEQRSRWATEALALVPRRFHEDFQTFVKQGVATPVFAAEMDSNRDIQHAIETVLDARFTTLESLGAAIAAARSDVLAQSRLDCFNNPHHRADHVCLVCEQLGEVRIVSTTPAGLPSKE